MADSDFVIENGVLVEYKGNDEKVVILSSVTEIGEDAFADCEFVKEIVIPDSVTKIGDFAFCGCSSLKEITIPNSVTEIGEYDMRTPSFGRGSSEHCNQ